MLARKKTSKNGKNVPQDWSEGLGRLLNETYKTECKKNNRYFDVYTQIYPEELLLAVSYLSETDPGQTPITCYVSCEHDQINTEEKVKETLKNYIEIVSLFFDELTSFSMTLVLSSLLSGFLGNSPPSWIILFLIY